MVAANIKSYIQLITSMHVLYTSVQTWMNAAMAWIIALRMLTVLTQWEHLTVSVLKDSLEMVS